MTDTATDEDTKAGISAAQAALTTLPGQDLTTPAAYLTPAEQRFAEHWLKFRNQIKAYQYAYPGTGIQKAKALAPALFRKPAVQREIRRIYERSIDLSAVDLARYRLELNRLALADFGALVDPITGDILPPHQWDADTRAAVSSYKESEDRRTGTITRTVRFHDKHQSLRTLVEMQGALRDTTPKDNAPRASFHFHIGGLPARSAAGNVPGNVTVTQSPALPPGFKAVRAATRARVTVDAEPGEPAARPSGKADSLPRPVSKSRQTAKGKAKTAKASKSRQSPAAAPRPPLFGDGNA